MKKLSAILAIGIAGCASYGNWRPTVDPYNDPNAHRIQQDLAECQQLAKQASGGTFEEAVKGGLVGVPSARPPGRWSELWLERLAQAPPGEQAWAA
jgi:hypothetical protein